MPIINKVTKLYPNAGATLSEEDIQAHIDEMNEDGWELRNVDNLVGWYRFFWGKEDA